MRKAEGGITFSNISEIPDRSEDRSRLSNQRQKYMHTAEESKASREFSQEKPKAPSNTSNARHNNTNFPISNDVFKVPSGGFPKRKIIRDVSRSKLSNAEKSAHTPRTQNNGALTLNVSPHTSRSRRASRNDGLVSKLTGNTGGSGHSAENAANSLDRSQPNMRNAREVSSSNADPRVNSGFQAPRKSSPRQVVPKIDIQAAQQHRQSSL